MEHYQLLKYAHLIPAVLILAGFIAHTFMLWKANRSGDATVLTRKLRVTRLYSMPAIGLVTLSLPVSGWWASISGWRAVCCTHCRRPAGSTRWTYRPEPCVRWGPPRRVWR